MHHTKIFTQKHLLPNRKNLRKHPTPFEVILWKHLRNGQLQNKKFRRQHSIGNYVADFYCAQEKLVVEIDGDSHFIGGAAAYDLKRTEFFNSLGVRVLRFTNREILESLEGVLVEIGKSFTHPNLPYPLLCKEGD